MQVTTTAGAPARPARPHRLPSTRTGRLGSRINTAPSRRAARRDVAREWLSKYGLIGILLSRCRSYYGISDLIDDGNLTRLGNNLVAGLSNGSVWALIALGYTLVYGIIELINFAHGDLFMIGSFTAFALWGTLGLTLDDRTARPGRRAARDADRRDARLRLAQRDDRAGRATDRCATRPSSRR